MKFTSTVISVSDVNVSRKFYQYLFGLELYQDYGINISFTCGLSLQQEFDWLVSIPKETVMKRPPSKISPEPVSSHFPPGR